MIPTDFPQATTTFGPPEELVESQCAYLRAFRGVIEKGSCEGLGIFVTAWRPTKEELERLNAGEPVFVTFVSGGLPSHMLSTKFEEAISPQ